ncbi:MAG: hypothetical protein LBB82_00225 [Treponema sp.]|jgi:hypothetical protein|nr:hypothetical protein [Treponema sp.]
MKKQAVAFTISVVFMGTFFFACASSPAKAAYKSISFSAESFDVDRAAFLLVKGNIDFQGANGDWRYAFIPGGFGVTTEGGYLVEVDSTYVRARYSSSYSYRAGNKMITRSASSGIVPVYYKFKENGYYVLNYTVQSNTVSFSIEEITDPKMLERCRQGLEAEKIQIAKELEAKRAYQAFSEANPGYLEGTWYCESTSGLVASGPTEITFAGGNVTITKILGKQKYVYHGHFIYDNKTIVAEIDYNETADFLKIAWGYELDGGVLEISDAESSADIPAKRLKGKYRKINPGDAAQNRLSAESLQEAESVWKEKMKTAKAAAKRKKGLPVSTKYPEVVGGSAGPGQAILEINTDTLMAIGMQEFSLDGEPFMLLAAGESHMRFVIPNGKHTLSIARGGYAYYNGKSVEFTAASNLLILNIDQGLALTDFDITEKPLE